MQGRSQNQSLPVLGTKAVRAEMSAEGTQTEETARELLEDCRRLPALRKKESHTDRWRSQTGRVLRGRSSSPVLPALHRVVQSLSPLPPGGAERIHRKRPVRAEARKGLIPLTEGLRQRDKPVLRNAYLRILIVSDFR